MLAAAVEGWDYPLARTDSILMDLYDLEFAKAGSKKRSTYPRPFKTDDGTSTRRGNTKGRSQADVLAILARAGHGEAPV